MASDHLHWIRGLFLDEGEKGEQVVAAQAAAQGVVDMEMGDMSEMDMGEMGEMVIGEAAAQKAADEKPLCSQGVQHDTPPAAAKPAAAAPAAERPPYDMPCAADFDRCGHNDGEMDGEEPDMSAEGTYHVELQQTTVRTPEQTPMPCAHCPELLSALSFQSPIHLPLPPSRRTPLLLPPSSPLRTSMPFRLPPPPWAPRDKSRSAAPDLTQPGFPFSCTPIRLCLRQGTCSPVS